MLMRDNILAFVHRLPPQIAKALRPILRRWRKWRSRGADTPEPFDLDFVLITTERSGSHLLMSLLSSHPLIRTHGEILLNGRVPRRIEGRKVGATIHYGQWKRRPSAIDFKKTKVIHLLRDPRGVALSQARNRIDQRIHGDRHRAHFRVGDEPPEIYEVDLEAIEKRTINIAAQQKEFTRMLRRKTVYTVTYEELTRNQSIETAPEGFARPLLDFLGVEHRRLRTTFAKSGPVPGQDVRP